MTAGNASAALRRRERSRAGVRGTRRRARRKPLARILSSASVGIDPTIMGVAPAYAMPRAIERAGLEPEDVDVYEVHEAFAAQVLGVLREFKTQSGYEIPRREAQPQRGAVALGHPFGDSGTRLVLSLTTEPRSARRGTE